jgi:hypothetical protein
VNLFGYRVDCLQDGELSIACGNEQILQIVLKRVVQDLMVRKKLSYAEALCSTEFEEKLQYLFIKCIDYRQLYLLNTVLVNQFCFQMFDNNKDVNNQQITLLFRHLLDSSLFMFNYVLQQYVRCNQPDEYLQDCLHICIKQNRLVWLHYLIRCGIFIDYDACIKLADMCKSVEVSRYLRLKSPYKK